jgi:hypothetical protein
MIWLMGLQFKIMYKKGIENFVADSQSHVAHTLAATKVSLPPLAWIQEVTNSYVTDSQAQ